MFSPKKISANNNSDPVSNEWRIRLLKKKGLCLKAQSATAHELHNLGTNVIYVALMKFGGNKLWDESSQNDLEVKGLVAFTKSILR